MGLPMSINRNDPRRPPWNDNHGYGLSDSDAESDHEETSDDLPRSMNLETAVDTGGPLEMFTKRWYQNRQKMTYSLDCENNGRILGGEIIPEEVLSLILSCVDEVSLLKCRLVCQRWKNIVDSDVWRFKLDRKIYRRLQSVLIDTDSYFHVLYAACKKRPFNKNLIKNPSGEVKMRYWEMIKNGGDGWRIENPPAGAEELPEDEEFATTSCFATSFSQCSKVQVIDLWAEGIAPIIMDELVPSIYVSEWYAARFDCASTYILYVVLMDKDRKSLQAFKETKRIDQWQGKEWHKVQHEFKNYCKGVRYIMFSHNGCDCQFWKGHYGSKMSRACVKVNL